MYMSGICTHDTYMYSIFLTHTVLTALNVTGSVFADIQILFGTVYKKEHRHLLNILLYRSLGQYKEDHSPVVLYLYSIAQENPAAYKDSPGVKDLYCMIYCSMKISIFFICSHNFVAQRYDHVFNFLTLHTSCPV